MATHPKKIIDAHCHIGEIPPWKFYDLGHSWCTNAFWSAWGSAPCTALNSVVPMAMARARPSRTAPCTVPPDATGTAT